MNLDYWSMIFYSATEADVSLCSSVYRCVNLCGQTVGTLVAEEGGEASEWLEGSIGIA